MRFFFPDSQDQVDPSFDFSAETRSETRVRQRDDLYAHECFENPPYDGLLVSMSMVDLEARGTTRYTLSQRHRFHRMGVRRFFRIDTERHADIETMGDCGAFNYVKEEVPPYRVEDVARFYQHCGFNYGVSVDHIIMGYTTAEKQTLPGIPSAPQKFIDRRELTLELADEFLKFHQRESLTFTPVGVAQGWSAASYSDSVEKLQKMGYSYIGLGGLVPLKTHEIVETLEAVAEVRKPDTELHLFGISRFEHARKFVSFGVSSIDSTSPFRQAFKSAKDNFYSPERNYVAIRIPQVDANTKLRRRIKAGEIDQGTARELESRCMSLLANYDDGDAALDEVIDAIGEYEDLLGKRSRLDDYRETLGAKPWKKCGCDVCTSVGIHAAIFRGSERNKRRGFHNLSVFYKQLQNEFLESDEPQRAHG